MECPSCGEDTLERDEVDVGVGTQVGPWRCTSCDYVEPTARELDEILKALGFGPPED